jgi:exopolysaccharide biosynthesis polyprenyl glycosylphosphotransferase
MIRRYGNALRALMMVADGVLAAVLGLIIYHALIHPLSKWEAFLQVFWLQVVAYALVWVGLLYLTGAYQMRAHWTVQGEARTIVRATFWLSVLGLAAVFISGADALANGWVLLLFPVQGLTAIAMRSSLRVVFMYFRGRGYNTRHLLILGTGDTATDFARRVHDHSVLGVKVVGYLGDGPPEGEPEELYWGRIHELPKALREQVVDEIAVCVLPNEWQFVEEYVLHAHEEGKLVRVPLAVPQIDTSRRFLEDLEGMAVLSYSSGPDQLAGHAMKRLYDLVVASAALILLSPLIVAVAVTLRLRQGPGILFSQTRVGMHGRPFTIFKFRTMAPDAEERYAELADRSHTQGAAFKMHDDPRVTPMGRFMRRYSLDELPQLFNVLRGEMSIVGPRPAPPREVEGYDLWHRRRLSMKPGITGLWQITSRFDRDFDRRAELDIDYIDRWSLMLDVTILVRTLPAIFRRPGT